MLDEDGTAAWLGPPAGITLYPPDRLADGPIGVGTLVGGTCGTGVFICDARMRVRPGPGATG
jgi:hypothetical protein